MLQDLEQRINNLSQTHHKLKFQATIDTNPALKLLEHIFYCVKNSPPPEINALFREQNRYVADLLNCLNTLRRKSKTQANRAKDNLTRTLRKSKTQLTDTDISDLIRQYDAQKAILDASSSTEDRKFYQTQLRKAVELKRQIRAIRPKLSNYNNNNSNQSTTFEYYEDFFETIHLYTQDLSIQTREYFEVFQHARAQFQLAPSSQGNKRSFQELDPYLISIRTTFSNLKQDINNINKDRYDIASRLPARLTYHPE